MLLATFTSVSSVKTVTWLKHLEKPLLNHFMLIYFIIVKKWIYGIKRLVLYTQKDFICSLRLKYLNSLSRESFFFLRCSCPTRKIFLPGYFSPVLSLFFHSCHSVSFCVWLFGKSWNHDQMTGSVLPTMNVIKECKKFLIFSVLQ